MKHDTLIIEAEETQENGGTCSGHVSDCIGVVNPKRPVSIGSVTGIGVVHFFRAIKYGVQ